MKVARPDLAGVDAPPDHPVTAADALLAFLPPVLLFLVALTECWS